MIYSKRQLDFQLVMLDKSPFFALHPNPRSYNRQVPSIRKFLGGKGMGERQGDTWTPMTFLFCVSSKIELHYNISKPEIQKRAQSLLNALIRAFWDRFLKAMDIRLLFLNYYLFYIY